MPCHPPRPPPLSQVDLVEPQPSRVEQQKANKPMNKEKEIKGEKDERDSERKRAKRAMSGAVADPVDKIQ
jgi:hypothetical protein